MKFSTLTRLAVVTCAALGMVVVATSQPESVKIQRASMWPTHTMIPKSVDMSQLQEFKDATTLHLNDLQKNVMEINGREYPNITIVITKVDFLNMWHDQCLILKDSKIGGGGGQGKPITPAELAMLTYVFDQGIDRLAIGSSARATVTPTGISGNITPKDMGMTPQQVKQAVSHYVASHPMRFWNEARIGLASGK